MNDLKIWPVGLFVLLLGISAYSQEKQAPPVQTPPKEVTAPAAAAGQSQQPQPAPAVDDKAVKVFLDKIEIEGRLEKPQAVFIIPGSNPEIDDINIERAFFNEIFRPVEKKGRVLARPTQPGQERKDVIPW